MEVAHQESRSGDVAGQWLSTGGTLQIAPVSGSSVAEVSLHATMEPDPQLHNTSAYGAFNLTASATLSGVP